MKTTRIATLFALTVLGVSVAATTAELSEAQLPPADSASRAHVIRECMVLLDSKVDVPAQEAGVLMEIMVKEGDDVRAEQQLAQIDDQQAQLQLLAATSQLEGAEMTANSVVRIKYAIAQEIMHHAEFDKIVAANREKPRTYPDSEVKRAEFQWKSSEFQIENAKEEQQIATHEAAVRSTEKAAAEASIQRRQLKSQINGRVEEILKMPGEWVQPGDIVMHVVNLEKLRVDAQIPHTDFHPTELDGREVRVTARIVNQGTTREMEFDGRIVFVSSEILGPFFRVRAEVDNQRNAAGWILYPGMIVDMAIAVEH